jgi:hypothetical protein
MIQQLNYNIGPFQLPLHGEYKDTFLSMTFFRIFFKEMKIQGVLSNPFCFEKLKNDQNRLDGSIEKKSDKLESGGFSSGCIYDFNDSNCF